jgi:hypothetical protein
MRLLRRLCSEGLQPVRRGFFANRFPAGICAAAPEFSLDFALFSGLFISVNMIVGLRTMGVSWYL